jgi:hypothetical protein
MTLVASFACQNPADAQPPVIDPNQSPKKP